MRRAHISLHTQQAAPLDLSHTECRAAAHRRAHTASVRFCRHVRTSDSDRRHRSPTAFSKMTTVAKLLQVSWWSKYQCIAHTCTYSHNLTDLGYVSYLRQGSDSLKTFQTHLVHYTYIICKITLSHHHACHVHDTFWSTGWLRKKLMTPKFSFSQYSLKYNRNWKVKRAF